MLLEPGRGGTARGFYLRQQLPAKLLTHEFKKLLPEDKALPAPDGEYFEIETAKAFHYGWSEWLEEPAQVRAKLIAHELHRGMRESYNFEMRSEAAAETAKPASAPAPWDVIRNKFFGGKPERGS